jgi:hypothetical protein
MDPRKRELLAQYLHEQQMQSQQAMVESQPRPDGAVLEEFKHQVKMWIELDNQIKKMMAIVKDKKLVHKELTERILSFMVRYNIEDLNTKDGKLRYKVTRVKPGVKVKEIKQNIQNYFSADEELCTKVMKAVFPTSEVANVVEKPSLRRLKSVNIISV